MSDTRRLDVTVADVGSAPVIAPAVTPLGALPETTPAERGAEPPAEAATAAGADARLTGRYGMSIQFDERPGDAEPGRLIDSTVWVNTAHPAYRRAVASRSEGYHVATAAALALARVAVEPADEHGFVTAFLTRWGELMDDGRTRRRARWT